MKVFYCRIKNNFDLDSASKNMGTKGCSFRYDGRSEKLIVHQELVLSL
jgi:hypothetical protein